MVEGISSLSVLLDMQVLIQYLSYKTSQWSREKIKEGEMWRKKWGKKRLK